MGKINYLLSLCCYISLSSCGPVGAPFGQSQDSNNPTGASAGPGPVVKSISLKLLQQLDPRGIAANYSGAVNGDIYNGIWGYFDPVSGQEFALLSSSRGMDLINLDDSTRSSFHIPLEGGAIHRDVVVYQKYAFVGGQEAADLVAIDLSDIDNPQAKVIPGFRDDVHTIGIHGKNLLLNTAHLSVNGGCLILDIDSIIYNYFPQTRPSEELLAIVKSKYTGSLGNDCHDSFVFDNILVASGGHSEVFDLVDISDVSSPTLLGRTEKVSGIYAHSVAVSEDKKYMFAFDEFGLKDILIYDISDPTSPNYVTNYKLPVGHVVHNGMVRGEYLFLASYTLGLIILDITDPSKPQEAAFYRTWTSTATGEYAEFNGAWNLYLGLPSGRILVSDTKSGLFVFSY